MARVNLVIALWLVIVGGSATAQQPIRWKFVPGNRFQLEINQQSESEITTPQGSQTTSVDQSTEVGLIVDSVGEGGAASVTQTIERIEFSGKGLIGGPTEYDSASETPPQGVAALRAPLFDALVGSPMKMELSSRGEVRGLVLDPKLAETLKENPIMGAVLSEEGLRQMACQSAMQLPEARPEQGATWTSTVQTPIPGAGVQSIVTTYVYDGMRDVEGKKLDVFKTKIVASIEPSDPPGELSINFTDQQSEGEVLFDSEAGRPVASTLEHRFTMTMNPMGQQVTSKTQQKVTTKWSPVPAEEQKPTQKTEKKPKSQ